MNPPPARPRLKRYVGVARVRDDYAILHGPNLFLKFTEDGVPLLLRLAPLLDGTRAVGDLAKAADAPTHEVDELVAVLHEHGVLEDAAADPAPRDAATPDDLLAFYAQFTDRPHAAHARVAESEVVLVGAGAVAQTATKLLAAAGVRKLSILDGNGAVHTVSAAEVREAADGAAHVLVGLDAPEAGLLRTVNDALLPLGVRWTPAVLEGPRAVVGPTVTPRRGPCWRCLELRRLGAEGDIDGELVLRGAADARAGPRLALPGATPAHAAIVGGLLAQEAILSVSEVLPPALAGRVTVLDLVQAVSQRHRVLRLPRCPSCGNPPVPDVDRFDLEPVVL